MTQGRPSTYTKEIGDRICDRLAEGESLRTICRDDDMPERRTVVRWVLKDHGPGFAAQYTQARELGLDEIAEECQEIVDDGSNDWMEKRNQDGSSGWAINGEALGRSRLRFDHRRWYLSKLAPKRFGDRTAVDLNGHLTLSDMSEEDIRAELAALANAGVIPLSLTGDEHPLDKTFGELTDAEIEAAQDIEDLV